MRLRCTHDRQRWSCNRRECREYEHVREGTFLTGSNGGHTVQFEVSRKTKTVSHSYNFVDSQTGAHTQNIESIWRQAKHRNNVAYRGTQTKRF